MQTISFSIIYRKHNQYLQPVVSYWLYYICKGIDFCLILLLLVVD